MGKPDADWREALVRKQSIWMIDWSAGEWYSLLILSRRSLILAVMLSFSYVQGLALKSGTHVSCFCRSTKWFLIPTIKFAWGEVLGGELKKGRATKTFLSAGVSPKFSLVNSHGNLFSSCIEPLLCTRHFSRGYVIKEVFLNLVFYCCWRKGRSKTLKNIIQ